MEETFTIDQNEVGSVEEVLGNTPAETGATFEGDGGDASTTTTDDTGFGGEGKLDPQQADAHRGEIVSVATTTAQTGTVGLVIQCKSHDTGVENRGFQQIIWGPQDIFSSDAPCWAGGHFDNTKLSKEPPPGKKQSADQAYARNFFNSKKNGLVQVAVQAAAEEGRTLASLGLSSPKNPEEYVSNLNAVLAGTQVVIVRKPEANDDPKFDGQLKVNALYPISSLNDEKFLARLRKGGVLLKWE